MIQQNRKLIDKILKASQAIQEAGNKSSGDIIIANSKFAKFIEGIKYGYASRLVEKRIEKIGKILKNYDI